MGMFKLPLFVCLYLLLHLLILALPVLRGVNYYATLLTGILVHFLNRRGRRPHSFQHIYFGFWPS